MYFNYIKKTMDVRYWLLQKNLKKKNWVLITNGFLNSSTTLVLLQKRFKSDRFYDALKKKMI